MAKTIVGRNLPIYKGEYNSATTYDRFDVVLYEGSSYVSKLPGNQNIPVTNTTYWQLLAQRGEFTEQQLEDFKTAVVAESKDEMDDYTDEKKTELDTYEGTKETELNTYAGGLKDDFDSNASEKTTAFNNNATSKTTEFNTNASNKTDTFNSNASDKTSDFNDNATVKTNAFNTNAADKTTAFDEYVDEKKDEINAIKEEIEGIASEFETDKTLSVADAPADAQAVGNALNVVSNAVDRLYTDGFKDITESISYISGKFVNNSGTQTGWANYGRHTDYIEVNESDKFKISGFSNRTIPLVVTYDSSFNFIEVLLQSQTDTYIQNEEITIPQGVKYIRCNAVYPDRYEFILYKYTPNAVPVFIPLEKKLDTYTLNDAICLKKEGYYLQIKWKYNNTYDMCISFGPGGANQFPSFRGNFLIKNEDVLNDDFTLFQSISGASTDWVSPYQLLAKNNGDGDLPNPSNVWVGGWHGTNNLSGNPTAHNYIYEIRLDNISISDDGIYFGKKVEIIVINKIQAGNTVLLDGGGREVMQETVKYLFRPGSMKIDTSIRALEDIIINTWYGFQTHNAGYASKILFRGDNILNYWHDSTTGTNEYTGNKNDSDLEAIVLEKNNNYLECVLNRLVGAGKLRYLTANKQLVQFYAINGSQTNTKCYYRLILNDNPVELNANKELCCEAEYKFYYLDSDITLEVE